MEAGSKLLSICLGALARSVSVSVGRLDMVSMVIGSFSLTSSSKGFLTAHRR